jgi:Clostripain family
MKPDAELERAAIADIEEMKKVTNTEGLHIAIQVERANDIERLEIRNGEEFLSRSPDPRPRTLAASLMSFLEWGFQTFPARHTMIVVWGHSRGVGWDLQLPARDGLEVPPPPMVPPLTVLSTSMRPDLPSDGLTIPDIRAMMAEFTGGPKLALLGFDSCYMSNAEFCYELRDHVEYLVASQSPIGTAGWDYRAVLTTIARRYRTLTPCELGEAIVHHITHLRGSTNLALVDLERVAQLADDFRVFVRALRDVTRDPAERRALRILLSRASFLKVRQFLDLRDLCYKVRDNFGPDIQDAAHRLLEQLTDVIAVHEAREGALGRLNGLSIYYPLVQASGFVNGVDTDEREANALVDWQEYEGLTFVNDTGWNALVRQLTVN